MSHVLNAYPAPADASTQGLQLLQRPRTISSGFSALKFGFAATIMSTLDEVEPAWRILERNGDATIFQAFDTFAAWTCHIAPAWQTRWFVVVVLDRSTRLPVMLLPLVSRRCANLTVIEAADLGVCDFNGPVLDQRFKPTAEVMAAIWEDVRGLLPPADMIRLTKLPATIGGRPNPLLILGNAHQITLSSYKTPLVVDGMAWSQDRLPNKLRTVLSVRRRKLEKRGRVCFQTAKTAPEADRFFAAMITQRDDRFAATGRNNILDCPSHRAFYRALVTPHAGRSVGHIHALLLDSEIIATGYGLVSDAGFHMIFPTFKADPWRNYSPGMLLFLESMNWAAQQGLTYYDFTIGGEEFKLSLGAHECPLYEHLEPVSLRGRPAVYCERLRRSMARCAPLQSLVHELRKFSTGKRSSNINLNGRGTA